MHDISQDVFSGLATPSLIIQSLDDRREFQFAPDAQIYPASMIKVPIAVAAAVAMAQGRIGEGPVEVQTRHVTTNDAPTPFLSGYLAHAWELIEHMLIYSDNTATNVLIDLVDRDFASAVCRDLGLAHTAIRRLLSGSLPRVEDPLASGENSHPTRDAALLFRLIAQGAMPYAARLESILACQYWNAKLGAGLDPGDVFAHKTGDTSDSSHDGGILTTVDGKRYIVVLYSSSVSNDETDAAFASTMRSLRPLLR